MPRGKKNNSKKRQEAPEEQPVAGAAVEQQKTVTVKRYVWADPTQEMLAAVKGIKVVLSGDMRYIEEQVQEEILREMLEIGCAEVDKQGLIETRCGPTGGVCGDSIKNVVSGVGCLANVLKTYKEKAVIHAAEEKKREEMCEEHHAKYLELEKQLKDVVVPQGYMLTLGGGREYAPWIRPNGSGTTFTTFDNVPGAVAAIGAAIEKEKSRAAEEEQKAHEASIQAALKARGRPDKFRLLSDQWSKRAFELGKTTDQNLVKQLDLARARAEFCSKCAKVPYDIEIIKRESMYCHRIEEYTKRIPVDVEIKKPEWADRLEIWEPKDDDDDDPILVGVVEVTEPAEGGREFFEITRW